ncbi:hypothetical protein ACK8P5_06050 [Paenibacillus sp. EC2-1]|uniref:hypothetical protein n=1 Tax=Paenibacillus sp. EC2-1 TaxID=3388665 RepID=UPI003BEEE92E
MRDELNRSTYADLVYKQNESMNPLEPMTDIPEDESKHVGTTTSQSLSREDADHSGFSQNVAGPADTSFSLGSEANETYPRRTPVNNTAFEQDNGIRHDEVFADKSTQSLDVEPTETTLEDVPDADELHAGSPVDPAVPGGIDQHGIDLLNGVGGVDDENERKLPDDF